MILNDFSQIQDGRQKVNFFKFAQIWSRLNVKNCKNSHEYTGINYLRIGHQIKEKIGKIRKSPPFDSNPNAL